MAERTDPEPSGEPTRRGGRRVLLEKHRWVIFVLPLLVFLLVGSLEPKPPEGGSSEGWLAIPYGYYPIVYTLKIALTLAAIVFVLPGYGEFPWRVSPLSVVVGLIGVVVWVGICSLELEGRLLLPLGLGWFVDQGARSAFNPLEQLHPAAWAWGFLAIRLVGLGVVIAVAEEFFLRGFLMRFVIEADWWDVPFGRVSAAAVLAGAVAAMLSHPAELLAAAVWFLLVTWLMVKTKNIWDCVVAHGITNVLLAVYVVSSGAWHLM